MGIDQKSGGCMSGSCQLSEDCIDHLNQALEEDEPAEKNFHIRQVLQACGFAETEATA